MTYCFRIRFVLGSSRISGNPTELIVRDDNNIVVALKVVRNHDPVNTSEDLALLGSGYPTEEVAAVEAARWRGALEIGFARVGIGADFGDRAATGSFTVAGLKMLEAQHGVRVLNDVHGTLVYECEPPPRFASTTAHGTVGKPPERVTSAICYAVDNGLGLEGAGRLAYDLFSASFFQPSADARLLMLMMATETLLELKPRSEAAVHHVNEMIAATKSSSLDPVERDSIVSTLQWLRSESIGQAGRRLAATLGDRNYLNLNPSAFFMRCYELRSSLVHGRFPRPERGEVDTVAANLELFVGNLLAGPLLDAVSD